jgi:ABC-type multidrug transport system fused ATPase/permease subunit
LERIHNLNERKADLLLSTSFTMTVDPLVEEAKLAVEEPKLSDVELGDKSTPRRTESVLEFQTDPFAPREGKALVWKNINMTLAASGKEKERVLLDNVWGEVPARETTAVMGPSGAGM